MRSAREKRKEFRTEAAVENQGSHKFKRKLEEKRM